jgi:hypothetical protein
MVTVEMPILIERVYDGEDGLSRYTVNINRNHKAAFFHNPKDGLAVCLRKAAEAVGSIENSQSSEMVTHD